MDFPRFVYLSPGKTLCQGGSFDGELVKNQDDHDAAIEAGYSDTVPEALEAAKKVQEEYVAAPRASEAPAAPVTPPPVPSEPEASLFTPATDPEPVAEPNPAPDPKPAPIDQAPRGRGRPSRK